jgi:hypothetical protein
MLARLVQGVRLMVAIHGSTLPQMRLPVLLHKVFWQRVGCPDPVVVAPLQLLLAIPNMPVDLVVMLEKF